MLREARRRARLSQTDLARRAGVAQSVISTYESDRREPGFRTFTKLIEGTGHQLSLQLIPPTQDQLGLPDTPLGRRLRRNRRAILDLVEHAGAHNPRVFGSVARAEDTDTSDVDLLVDLDDNVGLVALSRLDRKLSELLRVDVDVVPAASLKPGIRSRVLAEAIRL
ncbi:MAG: helix-turn-helix domain-containing protein [Pseudonocardiales bacterium]|nr:helix-turn-helix domain-containing protein [Pseudonocardiales bacterium]